MIKVTFPRGDKVLDHLHATLGILKKMDFEFEKNKSISLDFSEVDWVIPCSIILISNKVRCFLEKGAAYISYKPSLNQSVKKYMEAVGFPLGKKEDGNSFVSIKHFISNKKDPSQINKEVNGLLESIERKIPGEFGSSIKYIMGELSDNVDDHSEFKSASLMAQFFPQKKNLDIAVFDDGVTIPGVFEKNNISFETDSDSIKKAVWGEVTTKKEEEVRGYGLRTCKELSLEGLKGELYIISRKGILLLKSGKKPQLCDIEETPLRGTFLYFRLKQPDKKLDIYEYVE
ncbi:MAG: hypothetical protein KAI03_03820 [Candidatus Aureabacteria bacterium]|nr:hypothetical protein [Candidatus Auribacterota bacterium]